MDKPFAITLDPGSSLANKTGSWRTFRPVYVDRLPPCNAACPAGENIQGWLYHAESGDYEQAWRALTENNPLPAIMGRVCYHPCQGACNRQFVDSAVGINAVERFLGDEAIRHGWAFEKPGKSSGKGVLVVGAGPSGLSAAYHLARQGHAVEIHEAGPMAGGMMRFGIPKYRLPRDVLDAEVQRIVDLGVTLKLDTKVANIAEAMQAGRFDAAFLAVGAHIGKRAFIPAADATRLVDAVSVLRSHGPVPWGDPVGRTRNDGEVVPPPEDVRDDFSGISVCMHVRGYQRTTASLVTWLPADREERPHTVAALGSPCCSIFVPCGTGWVPEVLGDPAAWAVVARLADAVETTPGALAEVRALLDPIEDRIWEQAAERPGRPPLDGGTAWSAEVRAGLAAAADRVTAPVTE